MTTLKGQYSRPDWRNTVYAAASCILDSDDSFEDITITETTAPANTFTHEQFGQLRTIIMDGDGNPWFVAKDVCDALELRVNNLRAILDADEVKESNDYSIVLAPGGRAPLIISESGLYSLILRSRKPEAKAFKRWVTHEVLPAIRKTGGYLIDRPDDTFETIMARAAQVAQDTIKRMEDKLRIAEAQNTALRTKLIEATSKGQLVDDMFASIAIPSKVTIRYL